MSTSSVRVAIRYRPVNKKEQKLGAKVCVKLSGCRRACRIVHPGHPDKPHDFSYDQVYNSTTAQDDVYKFTGKPLTEDAIQGFNSTLFAYGQTGSGKTWSMMGIPTDEVNMGIIPRVGKDLFDYMDSYEGADKFQVSIEMYQIYKGILQDLFNPSATRLRILMGGRGGEVKVEGATEQVLHSFSDYMTTVDMGNSNRNVSATGMNAESSRSHCIIVLKFTRFKPSGAKVVSKVKMIDLAGSEKTGKTNAKAERLEEAKAINSSLTALASCMTALSRGAGAHIPYRSSTLTKMLQDSLGGNCKTSLLCATSPVDYNVDETLSTLRFGAQAKKVKTKVKMAVEYTKDELQKLVDKYTEEIEAYKADGEFRTKLDEVVGEYVASKGGVYAAMMAKVRKDMNKDENVDMSGMSFKDISSHVCLIDKKTGKVLAGGVVTEKIEDAGEVDMKECKEDEMEQFVEETSAGNGKGSAEQTWIIEALREEVSDLRTDSEGKDTLVMHLENEVDTLRDDIDAAVAAASKFESQVQEAEFYKRKMMYLQQDVMTSLTLLQQDYQVLSENVGDMEQFDNLVSSNASASDFKKMLVSMKKQLRKKDSQLKKMLTFKVMDDKYLAKYDTLAPDLQRKLFQKALLSNTAARGNVAKAQEAKEKFNRSVSVFQKKTHATKELKETWKLQMATLEKAVLMTKNVHERDSTKFTNDIKGLKAENIRLREFIQKMKHEKRSPSPSAKRTPTKAVSRREFRAIKRRRTQKTN